MHIGPFCYHCQPLSRMVTTYLYPTTALKIVFRFILILLRWETSSLTFFVSLFLAIHGQSTQFHEEHSHRSFSITAMRLATCRRMLSTVRNWWQRLSRPSVHFSTPLSRGKNAAKTKKSRSLAFSNYTVTSLVHHSSLFNLLIAWYTFKV